VVRGSVLTPYKVNLQLLFLLLLHVCAGDAYYQMCQPTTSSSTVSTSRRADALPPTGSVHLAGQGRPGYNRWERITGAQSTRCGHRRRIARCGGRYGPRWSGAAVSEWWCIQWSSSSGRRVFHCNPGKVLHTQAPAPLSPSSIIWWYQRKDGR